MTMVHNYPCHHHKSKVSPASMSPLLQAFLLGDGLCLISFHNRIGSSFLQMVAATSALRILNSGWWPFSLCAFSQSWCPHWWSPSGCQALCSVTRLRSRSHPHPVLCVIRDWTTTGAIWSCCLCKGGTSTSMHPAPSLADESPSTVVEAHDLPAAKHDAQLLSCLQTGMYTIWLINCDWYVSMSSHGTCPEVLFTAESLWRSKWE